MKFRFLSDWKLWQKLLLLAIGIPMVVVPLITLTVYLKQDALVQGEIEALNNTYSGLISIGDSHIAPFENFPYISIKIDDVKIYESKQDESTIIMNVADIFVGFNIWDLINAKYDIQKLLVEDGFINLITHPDGSTNITNALTGGNTTQQDSISEPFDIHLKDIMLRNVDIHQLDESTGLDIESFIYWADSGIEINGDELKTQIDTELELNIIQNGDTTFVRHKHFEFHTDVVFNETSGMLSIAPSGVRMENGDFNLEGSIDTKNDMTLDLHVNGTKPNFDMLIAFAPEDLIPTLERYNNAGEFHFNGDIVGPTALDQMPFIDLRFGADKAFLENIDYGKRVDDLGFTGHFTNGADRSFKTTEFSLVNFNSKLEKGNFTATLFVKNFVEPEVDLDLHTDFDLEFLAQFFSISGIENPAGNVQLDMHFHDIIDLAHPENALNKLNQAYYSELKIEGLHVESPDLPAPIENLDMHLEMTGDRGLLDTFNLKIGETDLSLKGSVTNLPAIVHHTNVPIEAELDVNSEFLDIAELTGFSNGDSTGIDEQVEDFSLLLKFKSSARAFTESKYLPEGEFFIERLHAQLKRFPHEIHDFYADVLIDSIDLRVVDFSGFIDRSDFHIGGHIHHYGALMSDTLSNHSDQDKSVTAQIQMRSDLIDVAELTDYSIGDSTGVDEQIEDFNIAFSFESTEKDLAFYDALPAGHLGIEDLHAQLKHYPHELHDFHADIDIGQKDIVIEDFTGFIDDSDFHIDGEIFDYGFWIKDILEGDVKIDLSMNADLLRLEDIFSYQGENYVPEDYRHEEFEKLKLHFNAEMHYKESALHSADIEIDQFDAKMHVHPMRFQDFAGRIHYEDEHLMVENLHGKMGRTVFDIDMNYYLGADESIKLRDNHFGLKANYIDFDQLTAFDIGSPQNKLNSRDQVPSTEDVSAHSDAYNIYELPFTDMTFDIDVDHFIYHRIDVQDIHSRLRTTHDHYVYVDTMSMTMADGDIRMSGYFNGSDPERIYLKPKLRLTKVDLDQMLFKFENFGQDYIISDNVHGLVSADITGKIRIYPDLVPDLDQSEIHMDVQLYAGQLIDFEPVQMLSTYMGNKNLSNIRFDTLQNHMDITSGVITIPNMTIESTLGHYELSGEQSMLGALEYYVRIPWKIVKQATLYKLFGKKNRSPDELAEDEIVEKDPNKKTRYLNLRVSGTMDDYDIKLFKKKKK